MELVYQKIIINTTLNRSDLIISRKYRHEFQVTYGNTILYIINVLWYNNLYLGKEVKCLIQKPSGYNDFSNLKLNY